MTKRYKEGASVLQLVFGHMIMLLLFGIRMFPISYKHFTHVGMLQSRYKHCKVEWLFSTWSDYVRYFASSICMRSRISQKWYEFTTDDQEIDRYG